MMYYDPSAFVLTNQHIRDRERRRNPYGHMTPYEFYSQTGALNQPQYQIPNTNTVVPQVDTRDYSNVNPNIATVVPNSDGVLTVDPRNLPPNASQVRRPALYNQQLDPFQRSRIPYARPTAPNAPQLGMSRGAAMLAGSLAAQGKGGGAELAGMLKGFNDFEAAKYNAAMNQHKADMAQYQDGVARYNEAVEAARATDKERVAAVESFDDNIGRMMQSYQELAGDDLTTGPLAGRLQSWLDSSGIRDFFLSGDKGAIRTNTRLLLKKLQVDQTLLNTANTKGAISDREMKLFMSPQPDMATTEAGWQQWIQQLVQTTVKVRNRIANGEQVPPEERVQSGTLQSVYGLMNESTPAASTSSQPSNNNQSQATKIEIIDGVVQ